MISLHWTICQQPEFDDRCSILLLVLNIPDDWFHMHALRYLMLGLWCIFLLHRLLDALYFYYIWSFFTLSRHAHIHSLHSDFFRKIQWCEKLWPFEETPSRISALQNYSDVDLFQNYCGSIAGVLRAWSRNTVFFIGFKNFRVPSQESFDIFFWIAILCTSFF